jgi:hypothetical protein
MIIRCGGLVQPKSRWKLGGPKQAQNRGVEDMVDRNRECVMI